MKIFDLLKNINPFSSSGPGIEIEGKERKVEAFIPTGSGTYSHLFSMSFDGEKNLGEVGPIISYKMDYPALRARSWQAYIESEVAQTVINKYAKWVVGVGLKLQAEPSAVVLESEGIKGFDSQKFSELVEARFKLFSGSSMSDYADMTSLQAMAYKAKINAIISGDCLVILRLVDGIQKIQLVDSDDVCSPMYNSVFFAQAASNGNKIKHGIEIDNKGQHVAYFVRRGMFEFDRVEARSSSGLVVSFLVYGLEYRLDDVRGIPLITVVMEKLKKMDRYSEATLGSAEERQKITLAIEHEVNSSGENPMIDRLVRARNADSEKDDIPVDSDGNILARNVSVTTNKQVVNMPPGSKLASLESKNELYFKDFFTVNIDLVCAALNIPPNVAMSKFDSNFSASRAALKDWEYTLIVDRDQFSRQYYKHVYNYYLEVEILKNKVQAPGYLQARAKNNFMVVEAYRVARWVGANVPHIDPEKEVRAERLKLGETGKDIPLTTVEAATEALNGGDSDANIEQYASELQTAKDLKIIVEPVVVPPVNP